MSNPKLSYDDITLVPEVVSDICSRSQCNPYDEYQYLPIFAAPMSSVVSFENVKNFNDARIRVVVPRSYPLEERLKLTEGTDTGANFVAFSLNEARDCFCKKMRIPPSTLTKGFPIKICIDLANGHMKCLLELVKCIKSLYGDKILIMTGNIANPETYRLYEEAGVDYVRVSIGTGNVCSTSSNTAIHYPVFSLLEEVYKVKKEIKESAKLLPMVVFTDSGISRKPLSMLTM